MRRQITRWMGTAACMLLAACAGTTTNQFGGSSFAPDSDRDTPRRTSSATVIEGEDIREQGGSLLSAMRHRMRSMQVSYAGGCPSVTLRGQKTVRQGASSPGIYVDGQQALDTCILEQVRPIDVDRIEVYPMGVASRPGYRAHPYGLILVFTRKA